jgi:hypothetical protein
VVRELGIQRKGKVQIKSSDKNFLHRHIILF